MSTDAQEECESIKLSETCDEVGCTIFQANGYLAVFLGALFAMPFAKAMGWAFGWLKEPYESALDGEDAGGMSRKARCIRRIVKGKSYSTERALMDQMPEDRSDRGVKLLMALMQSGKLFEGVPEEARRAVASMLEYQIVMAETVIEDEGDVGKYVYSILRGKATKQSRSPTDRFVVRPWSLATSSVSGRLRTS